MDDRADLAGSSRRRPSGQLLIAGATGTRVLLAVLGSVWRLTDTSRRLRLDRLAPGKI
jgi:hypothetical protein